MGYAEVRLVSDRGLNAKEKKKRNLYNDRRRKEKIRQPLGHASYRFE